VTAGASRPYAKAQALELFLKNSYTYSLEMRRTPDADDPIAMFLFDTRQGHCEYFASAMAVMLRQLGIPSRLVNGFRVGEYNRIAGAWTVRQYHAHSWVEAFFGPYGWVEFDPTPTRLQSPDEGLLSLLSDFSDAMKLWWWEDVIHYDFSKQYDLIGSARTWLDQRQQRVGTSALAAYENLQARIKSAYSETGTEAFRVWKWIWFGLISAALGYLLLIRRRGVIRAASRALRLQWHMLGPAGAVAEFYEDALALLQRHGMKRQRGQTVLEFAESLSPHPAAAPFKELTHLYYGMRFGSSEPAGNPETAKFHLYCMRSAFR